MRAPDTGFAHLLRLSDDTGLLEHARRAIPRREHGYCTDDVSRGLVVTSREPHAPPEVMALAERYLAFLTHAQDATGRFRNRMSFDRRWLDEPSLGDWWGRALWGLGTAAARSPHPWIRAEALATFLIGSARRSACRRAMAFAGLGAAEVLRAGGDEAGSAEVLLADAATAVGMPGPDPQWPWPEDKLTYANAALAEVLIAAGELLDDTPRLTAGLRMLSWLHDLQSQDGHLSVIAVAGWSAGAVRDRYDQQPIEVATLADAYATAAAATGDDRWETAIRQAAAWFAGDNDGGKPMWDPDTSGGYDGLTPDGPNFNQGAESTMALISTRQHARRLS